jgi:TRAP-type mannitol/chloroaromatic compound transport system permease large subunit
MVLSSAKPHLAPALPKDAIQLKPTNFGNLVLFLVLAAVFVGIAWFLYQSAWAETANWGFLAFLGIFFSAMFVGKREGGSLLGGILKGFVPPIFLIVMVLGSIFAGWATPTEAAGVGAFGALLLAFINGRLTKEVLTSVVNRTGLTTAMIFLIFVGATAFSTIFRNVYGEDLIIEFIEWLHLGPWPLLFLLMGTVFLLGFFFDFLEITLIILPVFSPVISNMAPAFAPHLGLEAPTNNAQTQYVQAEVIYWFAILVAVNLQTSFLTPPFGFALFYMKGVAPSAVKMQEIYKGIIPFVLLQLVGLAIVLEFPELALWLPRQVFGSG